MVEHDSAVRPVSGEPLPAFRIGRVGVVALSGRRIPHAGWRGGSDGIHAILCDEAMCDDDREAIRRADSMMEILNYVDAADEPLHGGTYFIAVRSGRIAGRFFTGPCGFWRHWNVREDLVGPPIRVPDGGTLPMVGEACVAPDYRGRCLGRALFHAACRHHGLAGPHEFLWLPDPPFGNIFGDGMYGWIRNAAARKHGGIIRRAVIDLRPVIAEWIGRSGDGQTRPAMIRSDL